MASNLGPEQHKLDPKLRMMANGSEVVNTLRAERSSALSVQKQMLLNEIPCFREPHTRPVKREELPKRVKRGKLQEVSESARANVFIELAAGVQRLPDEIKRFASAHEENLVTATVPLNELPHILEQSLVMGVQIGEQIVFSPPSDLATGDVTPDSARRQFYDSLQTETDTQVLVGIIDVQGFDFSHPDFLDEEGKTRFIRIWDQGGDNRPAPDTFEYGSELRQEEHLNPALEAASELGLPAFLLEPQSQMTVSSHGTHVASIAAGAHGVAPTALLAGVIISLPDEDLDRRKSFYDSTRIAHAVDYLFKLGKELGVPVSVNISLGTNGHAHDASSAVSRWIDHKLATPGRSVCVAAGNAGQEAPAEPGDWGFIVGRIHTSGMIPASGLTKVLEWIVIGDGIADLSENELEIWYAPQDRFAVEVKPPGSSAWIGPVEPGQYIENRLLDDGTFVSIYNERYAPANGHNYISIYLSPFLSEEGVVGVRAGTWQVRLIGREVRDGLYHCWIERDDPRHLGRVGMQEAWSFPSFFSNATNVDNSSISSLACGQRIVSVANLDASTERIHITSSQGPTRDMREKPETAAPGTNIVAANGFDPEHQWVSMTGTSMASPYVAGLVALMFSIDPKLTAAQITGILRRSARPLPGVDFRWQDDAGFGRIDPAACLEEAAQVNKRTDIEP